MSVNSMITEVGGHLSVPDEVTIPYIEGDGVGPDIWRAAQPVFENAVAKAYSGDRKVEWLETLAGEKAHDLSGEWLPQETLQTLLDYKVGIKGPLSTPIGTGIRSLNVEIRRRLDLYACIRPVKYIPGMASPMKNPQDIDMVIFRENTEDVYAGIEWPADSPKAQRLVDFLNQKMGVSIRRDSAVGIKPMSAFNSKRLIKRAIKWALDKGRDSVTLVHKGNIMKFTEGGFRDWGYEVAAEEFGQSTIPENELSSDAKTDGGVIIKDRIADAMFQQVLLRPSEYSVLAMPNLNGDYLSDALAAQVGGLGMAPGANVGDAAAVFEATHGTAPKYIGLDKVNPGSLILSGAFMFSFMGWTEAADLITLALERTIAAKTVTYDLARQMEGPREVKCSEFGEAIIKNMDD